MDVTSLLQPLSLESFASEYWGEQEYYNCRMNEELQKLIHIDAIFSYLEDATFYQKACVFLRSDSYDDMLKPTSLNEVKEGLTRGLTLQIRHLQNYLPKEMGLMQLAQHLQSILMYPLDSITLFYSLPTSMPTAIHKDLVEIFSLQISGKKKWLIAKDKCLTEQMSFKSEDITEWSEYILSAGQSMYLPSYLPHQVKCVDEPSTSIALIFKNMQYKNILGYIEASDLISRWLVKPMPILGEQKLYQIADEKIKLFLNQLSNQCLSFNSDKFKDEFFSALKPHVSEIK